MKGTSIYFVFKRSFEIGAQKIRFFERALQMRILPVRPVHLFFSRVGRFGPHAAAMRLSVASRRTL